MNTILNQMLSKYTLKNKEDYVNALKEVIQEIALSALAKTDFFEYAAFYGGTALRIFYGLDRFSEDLDFSLIEKSDFDLTKYFKTLDDTFKMYGLSFTATKKEKTIDSSIQSAFLKGNTLEHVLLISTNKDIFGHIQKNEVIKIKFEVLKEYIPYFCEPEVMAAFTLRATLSVIFAPFTANCFVTFV